VIFGIQIASYVESIGGIFPEVNFINKFLRTKNQPDHSVRIKSINSLDKSEVRVLDEEQGNKIIK